MKIKTTRYDASKSLETKEDMALYLNEALNDGDPELIQVVLGHIAKAKGMSQIAKETGLSRESLYRALSEKGNPNILTIDKVAKSLGFRLTLVES